MNYKKSSHTEKHMFALRHKCCEVGSAKLDYAFGFPSGPTFNERRVDSDCGGHFFEVVVTEVVVVVTEVVVVVVVVRVIVVVTAVHRDRKVAKMTRR